MWALGAILFELCSLTVAFKSYDEIIGFKDGTKIISEDCPNDPNFQNLISKLLKWKSEDRATAK